MIGSLKKAISDFFSYILNKILSVAEPLDILEKKLAYFEKQINIDHFDPNLSLKIDSNIVEIESIKSAHLIRQVGDP